METTLKPPTWKTLSAFAIIYFVWGSTFLAIRIGVHEVPPFLFASMRFLTAGFILYGWMIAKGEQSPTRPQWLSIFVIALLIFVFDYGLLFWAEQRVPSGIAAVMLATIPVFMALSEILFLRTQKLTIRLAFALLIGLCGVGVLMSHSLKLGGGVLLFFVATGLGEFRNFHPSTVSRAAWLSLLYLIVAGSIIGFTAYVWLIHHESPTKVGTYAYVNPVVAVFIGYFFGGEALGLRTILGTMFVLLSVIVITTTQAKKSLPALATKDSR